MSRPWCVSVRSGFCSAQTEPPPVSETLEAAKLGALASGTVLAGPGQVIVPAGTLPDPESANLLWKHDHGIIDNRRSYPARNVTLTVQGLGSCELRFFVAGAARRGATFILEHTFVIGPHHDSGAFSARAIRVVRWDVVKTVTADCPFLWVLRSG